MGMSQRRRILTPIVALGVVGLALAGCTGGGGDDGGGGDGDTVTIMGAFTDAQAEAFQADLDAWSEETRASPSPTTATPTSRPRWSHVRRPATRPTSRSTRSRAC